MTRSVNGLGWRKDQLDPRDHVFGVTHSPRKLPKHVSLRDHMPPVYDQGQLGSCTANAIAAAMEYQDIREGQAPITPSRLFIYYHERLMEGTVAEDAGAEIRDGIKVVANIGVPPEKDWPYHIKDFAKAPSARAEADAMDNVAISYARIYPGHGAPLRSALAHGFPVLFGFTVPQEFEELSTVGPLLELPQADTEFLGGHAVLAVGYDFSRTRFLLDVVEVRNSWGDSWGESGYFFMDAAWFTHSDLVSDLWTIRKVS